MDEEVSSPERPKRRKVILRTLGQASLVVLAKMSFMGVLWLLQHHFDIF